MVEINQIENMASGTVADEDLLVVYDVTAARTFSISRSAFLAGFARGLPPAVSGSVSVTIPVIAAGAESTVTATVPGAAIGSSISLSFDGGLPSMVTASAYVSAADTVTIRFVNGGAAATTAEAKVARIMAWGLS